MTALDHLNAFLAAQRPALDAQHLHSMTVTTALGERTVGARAGLDLLDQVASSNQLDASLFFRYAETADDRYIRPVGTGNNWERFDPRAALTVADIT